MGHVHACPLYLKLMRTTLSHILDNEETRDNTFDYIFPLTIENIAPKSFRLFHLKMFRIGYDLSCPLTHHC